MHTLIPISFSTMTASALFWAVLPSMNIQSLPVPHARRPAVDRHLADASERSNAPSTSEFSGAVCLDLAGKLDALKPVSGIEYNGTGTLLGGSPSERKIDLPDLAPAVPDLDVTKLTGGPETEAGEETAMTFLSGLSSRY